MNFSTSSQHEKWTFTPEKLVEVREANREKAIACIKQFREAEQQEPAQPEIDNGKEAGKKAKKKGKAKPISIEDELKILQFYAGKIAGFCQAIKLPNKVKAAAQIYLRRFYLTHSSMDFSPGLVTIACIYLAGKIEDNYISAESLAGLTRQEESTILQLEPVVLEGLKLDLIVYAPYRALSSFIETINSERASSSSTSAASLSDPDVRTIQDKGNGACDALLTTDAPLLFPPGQIALAALRSSMQKFSGLFDWFLELLIKAAPADHLASSKQEVLRQALQQIDKFGVQGATSLDADEVKRIDRQLKLFHNLSNDPNSKEYQKRKEKEKERQYQIKAEKRAAKRAKTQAIQLSLLGPSLDVAAETSLALPELHNPGQELPVLGNNL